MSAVEINCKNCGTETLLRREAVYTGFTKTGERLFCAACGYEYADETAVPFKTQSTAPAIFTDADRPKTITVFHEAENKRLCRYCAHYITNPFTQFCSVHKKEIQATDTCDRFEPSKKEAP